MRHAALPCLPGFNFNDKIGKTAFHKPQYFERVRDGVCYVTEKPGAHKYCKYASIWAYDDEPRAPTWIAYDGQRLMFKAYFQETVQERWEESHQIRLVTISFFLEDGTMKIVEPAIDNSGLEQGVLVRRQRIPMPDPVQYKFYDIIDLNIGKEPEIFGRVYKIIDCDKFTRRFLNRLGIAVSDPLELPRDSYIQRRGMTQYAKKPNRKVDTLEKFLKYDRKVLKFDAYWDDRGSEFGVLHDLELRYYLADDTIEIKENLPTNAGRDGGAMFLKRMKIPKFFTGLEPLGSEDPFTVLNVLGDSGSRSYFIPDILNTGKVTHDYYKDSDLTIGTRINVFGREVVITNLDPTTREYYRDKYGIEEFKPLEKPTGKSDFYPATSENPKPPPYNGFGSYEDSLGNCYRIIPKPPKFDFVRFAEYDKHGYDSKVLSFRAKMISDVPQYTDRLFIIRVYLMDNTISVFEIAVRNTGFQQRPFQKRLQVALPGQELYGSEKPLYYQPNHFYIGACMNLGGFVFKITSADSYTLRYMELNGDKFSRASAGLIMGKIRVALKPAYRHFLEQYCPATEIDGILMLPYEKLREALLKHLGCDNITEHEIITIARRYAVKPSQQRNTREYLRGIIHTELIRFLWNDLDRLAEDILHWDVSQSGFLPPNEIYTILRGCRIPVDPELLNCVISHLRTNDEGKVDTHDLLDFMNVKINPVTPTVPVPTSAVFWWNIEHEDDCCPSLNWREFIGDLDIKEDDPASAIQDIQ